MSEPNALAGALPAIRFLYSGFEPQVQAPAAFLPCMRAAVLCVPGHQTNVIICNGVMSEYDKAAIVQVSSGPYVKMFRLLNGLSTWLIDADLRFDDHDKCNTAKNKIEMHPTSPTHLT